MQWRDCHILKRGGSPLLFGVDDDRVQGDTRDGDRKEGSPIAEVPMYNGGLGLRYGFSKVASKSSTDTGGDFHHSREVLGSSRVIPRKDRPTSSNNFFGEGGEIVHGNEKLRDDIPQESDVNDFLEKEAEREEEVLQSPKAHTGDALDVDLVKVVLAVGRGYILLTAGGVEGAEGFFSHQALHIEGGSWDESVGDVGKGAVGGRNGWGGRGGQLLGDMGCCSMLAFGLRAGKGDIIKGGGGHRGGAHRCGVRGYGSGSQFDRGYRGECSKSLTRSGGARGLRNLCQGQIR